MGRTEEAIKGEYVRKTFMTACLRFYSDLRAALRVQPSNTEALEEMLSLLPSESSPPLTPLYPDEATSSSVGGTSTTPRSIPLSNQNHFQIPKPKSPKQLPFGRTRADDRKLKIMSIPVMFEVPEYIPGDPSSTWRSTRAQKVKNVTTKTETFIYPSWEKYTVKQVG